MSDSKSRQGQVGSGKSTVSLVTAYSNYNLFPNIMQFINRAAGNDVMTVGHNLTSETKSVAYCALQDPRKPSRRFILVDTPGFDDYRSGDRKVLDSIVKWMKDS
ncbi:hypothetical protein H0H87_009450 [Tephrocybe sp. NHM501043]|nr:hypothetical protein H0H87_009450 [Tephrocybe sp. NHM501043]